MTIFNRFNTLSLGQKFGGFLLLLLLIFAFLQPIYYPIDANIQDLSGMLQSSSVSHWFGTDHFGRDMLARVASAIRLSFSLIVLSVGFALFFGLLLGVLSGYFGGWIDFVCRFLCDIVMALPGLLFVLLFAAIAPNSFWSLYLGISLVLWVEFFRMVRAMTQTIASSREIEASRLMGMDFFYCFKRHFLPKLLPVVATLSAFAAGNAVLALATLGFINVGLRPPTAELGLMMTELFPYYYQAPFVFLQPIIAVFVLVLSLQLLSGKTK
ncbi:MAG: ABC transporter permease [Psychrobacter sp.]|uniref:Dipeptide transport system permease protein DppC n=1 Tax=Psychrobacter alimentarius TaxID=261164 RepID=A0ABN4N1M5_9GAMM|nr:MULTISPECIES: ABC transporter permease [Psychrobacter]AMT96855.1 Dipeptide transport system permease protein DppC [Psychrobacter alimentarius]MBO6226023.1 ABC transporter permease [Psychrobacter sp.]QCB30782.1 ABC transporter permease [Psychrobacter sp. PAMC27889]